MFLRCRLLATFREKKYIEKYYSSLFFVKKDRRKYNIACLTKRTRFQTYPPSVQRVLPSMSQFGHLPEIKTKPNPNRSPPPRMGPAWKRAEEEAKKFERANMANRDPHHADSRRSVDMTEKAEEVLSPRSELVKRAEAKKAGRAQRSDSDLARFRANARRMADTAKEAAEANIGELDQHAERMLRLEIGGKMQDESRPEAIRRAEKERKKTNADLKKRVAKGEDVHHILNQPGGRWDRRRRGPAGPAAWAGRM